MFRADLAAARAAWLESHIAAMLSDPKLDALRFYVDDTGRYADFHSLRHTFISNLAVAGVHPKTAQRLAPAQHAYMEIHPLACR